VGSGFLRTCEEYHASQHPRERVVAKLLNACNELEDALNFSVRVARDDAVIIPEALRNELSVIVDDLRCMLRNLEDIP